MRRSNGNAMAYSPLWMSLALTRDRIVGRSGIGQHEAEEQLACAIGDRAVEVRGVIDKSDREMGGQIFRGDNLAVPDRPTAEDIDWSLSRPKVDWETGFSGSIERRYFGSSDWRRRPIAVVEVYLPDVDRIWPDRNCVSQASGDVGGAPNQGALIASIGGRTASTNASGDREEQVLTHRDVSAGDQSAIKLPRRKPGAVPRGRTYAATDAPLVQKMGELIAAKEARNPWDAALQVCGTAEGFGDVQSKAKRLVRRYSDYSELNATEKTE
jgi:hypothetical protein